MKKMKVVQVNTTCGVGSTGKICVDISKKMTEEGIENYILFSSKTNGYELGIQCADDLYIKAQALKSHVFGNYGFNSVKETKKIIQELEKIEPDIVHLHNIHGHDCSLEMLFQYIKRKSTKLVWTFHDCWAFTAYCPHFTFAKCDKWKTGCQNCPQFREYSILIDNSNRLYERKAKILQDLDMTIVTPSKWLENLVEASFLYKYPVEVIHNGIDLSVFKPTESNFRQRYGISQEKKVVLGVAFDWGIKKGLDVFIELSRLLDPEKYQIVLVGTNNATDVQLPKNIISIHRTQNPKELAEIYTAADLFVNPTREDNYPTVNMEAIACGTPVLSFATGGSPESIDVLTGSVIECGDFLVLKDKIYEMTKLKRNYYSNCLIKSRRFNKSHQCKAYYDLYKKIISNTMLTQLETCSKNNGKRFV